jgi:hypothetical protein
MGRRSGDQTSFFYEFRLDDRVPKNHLLRRINVFVTAALACYSACNFGSDAILVQLGSRGAD